MLRRIHELLKLRNDFGFETTLASKGHTHIIHEAKKLGYTVVLIYFLLESPDLSRARVNSRGKSPGVGQKIE